MKKRLKKQYGCPVELSLAFVGGKWKTVILARLKEAPSRYSELREQVPGIADKVLTEQLKDLEALELVERRIGNDRGVASAYSLTERGESLRPILDALYLWGEAMAEELEVTVGLPSSS